MRSMGIDYGSKRVGVALTDEAGQMAFPHKVLVNDSDLVSVLVDMASDYEVGEIVIGHSLDRSGKENEIHSAVKEIVTELTLKIGVPIQLEPEQYTTQEAVRIQGKNEHTDASAAAIILNSYLTKKQHD